MAQTTARGGRAFLQFLLPALQAIGGGSAIAGAATAVGGIAQFLGNRKDQRQATTAQVDQQRAQRDALAASEREAQEAYRSNLRASRTNQGSGDFQTTGGSFSTALKTITGR